MQVENLVGMEWVEWKNHPKTRQLRELLQVLVQEHQDSWLNREFEDENPHKWAIFNSAALAEARTIEEIGKLIDSITLTGENSDQ